MNAAPRRTVSAVTLSVTVVVVLVMAVWGFNAATAPIDDNDVSAAIEDGKPTCGAGEALVESEFIRRAEVTVSVYNAGKKSGRAAAFLSKFEDYGFRPGDVGNAPEGTKVAKAEVRAKASTRDAANLVAAALGKGTPVVLDEDLELGPGVVVYVGDAFRKLNKNAPRQVKRAEIDYDCV